MHDSNSNMLKTDNTDLFLYDYRNYSMISDQYNNYFNNGQPFFIDRGDLTFMKGNINECIDSCNKNSYCTGFVIDSPHPNFDGNYDCFLKNDFNLNSYYNSNSIIYSKPFLYNNINNYDKISINETKIFDSVNGALYDCNNSSNCIGFISDNDKNLHKSIYINTYDPNLFFSKHYIL